MFGESVIPVCTLSEAIGGALPNRSVVTVVDVTVSKPHAG